MGWEGRAFLGGDPAAVVEPMRWSSRALPDKGSIPLPHPHGRESERRPHSAIFAHLAPAASSPRSAPIENSCCRFLERERYWRRLGRPDLRRRQQLPRLFGYAASRSRRVVWVGGLEPLQPRDPPPQIGCNKGRTGPPNASAGQLARRPRAWCKKSEGTNCRRKCQPRGRARGKVTPPLQRKGRPPLAHSKCVQCRSPPGWLQQAPTGFLGKQPHLFQWDLRHTHAYRTVELSA